MVLRMNSDQNLENEAVMNTTKIALGGFNLAVLATFSWLYVSHFHPDTVSAWDQTYIHFMDDNFGGSLEEEQ